MIDEISLATGIRQIGTICTKLASGNKGQPQTSIIDFENTHGQIKLYWTFPFFWILNSVIDKLEATKQLSTYFLAIYNFLANEADASMSLCNVLHCRILLSKLFETFWNDSESFAIISLIRDTEKKFTGEPGVGRRGWVCGVTQQALLDGYPGPQPPLQAFVLNFYKKVE